MKDAMTLTTQFQREVEYLASERNNATISPSYQFHSVNSSSHERLKMDPRSSIHMSSESERGMISNFYQEAGL
jgi:hypothetical protein